MKEKDRSLEDLLNPAFRPGNGLQGKTPELPLGGKSQGDFEPIRFVAQTKAVVVADGDQALYYVDLSPSER